MRLQLPAAEGSGTFQPLQSIPFESVGPLPGLKLQLDRSSSLKQTSALDTQRNRICQTLEPSSHKTLYLDRPSNTCTYTQPTSTTTAVSSTAGTRTRPENLLTPDKRRQKSRLTPQS